MVKCKECGNETKLNWNHCPHCGSEIRRPTPEEAKAAIELIRGIKKRLRSELDMSPEGIEKTKHYIDEVSQIILSYSKLLKGFMDHHAKAKKKPRLFRNEEWRMTAKVCLVGLVAVSIGVLDGNVDSKSRIPEMPLGCQRVGFELMKIQMLTESLAKDYDAFIEGRDPDGLEKAGKSIEEISDRIQRALDEIDAVIRKVSGGIK